LEIVKLPEALETSGFTPRVIEGDKTDPPPQAMPVQALAQEVPVMGRIAAGVPIEAISQVSHSVAVPGDMLAGSGHHYALEVKGDSMIDAGINDGDVVVIREDQTAESGDIVVALVDGQEATLKRFRRKGNAIALEAANPAYETRVFRDDQVRVQGKLVGLIRTY
jgi:repressor LexA